MGLTWIDHDTIEKPIEEITLGTEEAVDIEFTVETLKSANANEHHTASSLSSSTGPRMKPITKKVMQRPSLRSPNSAPPTSGAVTSAAQSSASPAVVSRCKN